MAKRSAGTVRVIGGEWRGRRLPLASPDIRPTADRIRETLFNWLDPQIRGAAVLDLFAGSGALAFEALSRGAARAFLVEQSVTNAKHLRQVATSLNATSAKVLNKDARTFLQGPAEPFDVVLLDPPFADSDAAILCTLLERRGWLAPDARIYIEQSAENGLPELPVNWELVREKQAGRVSYGLAVRRQGAPK